jgi:hypothetical protein
VLIERGEYNGALRIAEAYKRYALNSIAPSPAEEAINVAYAYHMIAKAMFFLIANSKSARTYKNYLTFFFANVMCTACLQAGRGVAPKPSDPDEKIVRERDSYYRELYQKCDGDPNLEKADIDANERVSEMIDASPFFWT